MCFPELCFLQFSVAQVLGGLGKQFMDNFGFITWACAAGFNNNNNNNNGMLLTVSYPLYQKLLLSIPNNQQFNNMQWNIFV